MPAGRLARRSASACRQAAGDRRDRAELDVEAAPVGGAAGDARVVEAASGVLHEGHRVAAAAQAADRGVVADVRRHPEQHDPLGPQRVEHLLGVGVGEHVEALLEQEDLAAAVDQPADGARRVDQLAERHRVVLPGLGHLVGAAGAAQAVRRVGVAEVRGVADLGVAVLVVVGRGDVHQVVGPGPLDEPAHRRQHRLGARHVEPAVGQAEVDLGVDVPQELRAGRPHSTRSRRGFGFSPRPTLATGAPSQRTTSAV